jgi:hypothetical protein
VSLHWPCPSLRQQPGQANTCCKLYTEQLSLLQLWGAVTMPFVFSHTKFCDIWILQLQCTCCYRRIPRHFPDWKVPSKRIFSPVHQTLCETGCLPSAYVQLERKVVPEMNVWENILDMVQKSPKLCTYRIAPHISVSHAQVWQTVHEDGLHPYHDQRVSPSWTRGHCIICGFVPLDSSTSSIIKCHFIHRWNILYLG